jgi:uroporphyrin-III C-methyltransferase/precorrin-2 dehydrogenase/sirohydrochlorin ferrochelatase
MGLVSINIICDELIKNGMNEETPCALVQQGTTNTQKEYISILKDMPALVKVEKPKPPTIFIIGGVVSLRDKLKWYTTNAED